MRGFALRTLRFWAGLSVLAVSVACGVSAPAGDDAPTNVGSEALPQFALVAPPTRTATPERAAAAATPMTLSARGQFPASSNRAELASAPEGAAPPTAPAAAASGASTDQSSGESENGGAASDSGDESDEGEAAAGDSPATGAAPGVPLASCPSLPGDLLERLRRGGTTVYFRHAMTDWSQSDREVAWVNEWPQVPPDPSVFTDCGRQRLLTDEGRAHAAAVGRAVGSLGIPIGTVVTSRWCRVIETAQLAFGGSSIDDRLFDSGYLDSDSPEREQLKDELRDLLGGAPEGQNLFIVGHMPQLFDVTGLSLEEGESAVFQRDDGDLDTVVGRMSLADWTCLAGS